MGIVGQLLIALIIVVIVLAELKKEQVVKGDAWLGYKRDYDTIAK